MNKLFLGTSWFRMWCKGWWVTDLLEGLIKRVISFMCFINCTLWESSMLVGTWLTLLQSMLGKYRTAAFSILSSVWMNTLPHSLSQIACVYTVGVRFYVDSNSWNVNGTPNITTVRQMLRVLSQLAIFLHSLAYFFSLVRQHGGGKYNVPTAAENS